MTTASKPHLNLVINPGSTSTKLGVFSDSTHLASVTVRHTQEELSGFSRVYEEREFRTRTVIGALEELGYESASFDGVIAIAGRLKPGPSGAYYVNEAMLEDMRTAKYREHASNLGALIAWDIAALSGTRALVADAVTSDEMIDEARLSGMPELERHSACHVVNQKRMARRAATEMGLRYDEVRLIVCHLGGGISVVAHRYGRMVDGNVPMGEGPFCIDRSGSLNSFELAELCYSGKYTRKEMLHKIRGGGGVSAYLNTRDFRDVCSKMNAGDALARRVFDAMAYQVSREIGAAAVSAGGPDAIVLTGGMANSRELVEAISERVSFLGPIYVYPGEEELEALNDYLVHAERGEITPMSYGE